MAKKKPKSFRAAGHVADCRTHRDVAGLRVEAWDKDLPMDDFVGETVTDEQGAFRLEFAANRFRELLLDREPDLCFRVYRDRKLIKSTEDSVLWNVKAGWSAPHFDCRRPHAHPHPRLDMNRSSRIYSDGRVLWLREKSSEREAAFASSPRNSFTLFHETLLVGHLGGVMLTSDRGETAPQAQFGSWRLT